MIPEELTAIFDMRIPPTMDHVELEQKILGWCKEAGDNVTISFQQKEPRVESTKLDNTNPYWVAFKNSCDKLGLNILTGTFPGGTDSRFVREVFSLFSCT